MEAYDLVYHYEVTCTCLTPFRTGRSDGNMEYVLRYADGIAFIQGASIAGTLRSWMEQSVYGSYTRALFGAQAASGNLMISDGCFDQDAEQTIRPRLRIDPNTGAAADKGKFDVAHISPGANFTFTLTWLGTEQITAETEAIDQALAALHTGEFSFGAQKTNGFGRVSLEVARCVLNMYDPQQRNAWLSSSFCCQPYTLPDLKTSSRVRFTVRGRMDSVLVKSGQTNESGINGVVQNIKEGGCYIIPGSSVKGAVRARCETIANAMHIPKAFVEQCFGHPPSNQAAYLAGQIWFSDVRLSDPNPRRISRIRINRFTGGVLTKAMLTEEPLSCTVSISISAPDDPALCGMLLYALRDLGLKLYGLGSGRSIGRGFLSNMELDIEAPSGTLTATAEALFDADQPGIITSWLEALEGRSCHES